MKEIEELKTHAPLSLDTRLLWATRVVDPLQMSKLHYRVGVTVWKLEKGAVRIRTAQEVHDFEAPCCILLGAGWSAHSFAPKSVLCSVSVRVVSNEGPLFVLPLVLEIDFADLPGEMEELIDYFGNRARKRDSRDDALYRLNLQAVLSRWCLHLGRLACGKVAEPFAHGIRHPGLRKAMMWWHDQPQTENITEPELARAGGLSVSHFKRMFQNELGMSLREYRCRVKMEACVEALLHTEKSIKEIGLELGFAEPSSFVRWFRKYFNQTPKGYRDSH